MRRRSSAGGSAWSGARRAAHSRAADEHRSHRSRSPRRWSPPARRRRNVMAISIGGPQLGASVSEGTRARWLRAVGDKVRKEEPLVEIQTDKINVEIPSPAEGTLSNILVPEGTTVLVGTEIGQIGALGEATAVPVAAAAAK